MKIEIEKCMPGMVLNCQIMHGDTVLVSKGQKLTASLISKLKAFGITHIEVVSDYTIDPDLYDNVKESLENNDIIQVGLSTAEVVSSILNVVDSNGSFSKLNYDMQTFDNIESLDHSVRVAIFSVVLAHLYNENLKKNTKNYADICVDIYDVALAALMHEKGKNQYSTELQDRINSFATNEEHVKEMPGIVEMPRNSFNEKFIPVYSFCFIDKMPELSNDTKLMVLYSGESDNLSGPLKTLGYDANKSNNVRVGARIIRICSLYDNCLSHFYHTEEPFENIITFLGQAGVTKMVDEELANLFLNNVPIYPLGAKVLLSNGEEAVVVKTFPGYTYTTRPAVKLLSTEQIYDLRYATNVTIKSVIKNKSTLDQVVGDQITDAKRR